MDHLHKLQSDKLKRAYGEIIELKAEVALLKREQGKTMLNKSKVKEKVEFTLGFTLVLGLILWALAGCAPPEDNNGGGDDPGTGPPPPNSGCDYNEMENNDTPDASNFITNLPSLIFPVQSYSCNNLIAGSEKVLFTVPCFANLLI